MVDLLNKGWWREDSAVLEQQQDSEKYRTPIWSRFSDDLYFPPLKRYNFTEYFN
jgi:hypothetical protein